MIIIIITMTKYICGEVQELIEVKCSVILLAQKGEYPYPFPSQDRDFTVKKCA